MRVVHDARSADVLTGAFGDVSDRDGDPRRAQRGGDPQRRRAIAVVGREEEER